MFELFKHVLSVLRDKDVSIKEKIFTVFVTPLVIILHLLFTKK